MARDFTTTTRNYPTGADTPIKRVIVNRAPLTSDTKNFTLGDEWLDNSAYNWWKLVRVSGNPAVAKWVLLGSGNLEFISGNIGGQVGADGSNNINLVGAGAIVVSGNPGTNTLTITDSSIGNIASITGNSGGAVIPDGLGNINIVGLDGVSVVGNVIANTLQISAQDSFFWSIITLSQAAVKNNGYFTNGVGVVQLSLPAISAIGDTFEVADIGGNFFQITQIGGQQIRLGKLLTTAGVGGSLTSTALGDHLTLVCVVANTIWIAFDPVGNFTVI